MIRNRKDLQVYLRQDQIALGLAGQSRPHPLGDEIWRFQRLMRRTEYHANCARGPAGRLVARLYRLRYHRFCVRLGFHLPLNVFGPGLSIAHIGALAVNSRTRVGKNCRIHAMVVIGASGGDAQAPILGDNVYIGAGAKILGPIRIADNVAIGANAVVIRSIDEPGTTWAGVPARKVSENSSRRHLCQDLWTNAKKEARPS